VALTDREMSHVSHPPSGVSGEFRVEFFQKFRRLNIHSSEELDKAIADAEQAMTSPGLFGGTISREELKDSAGLRAAVATKLSAAMASIEGMMVNQPRRAINRRQAEK